jgi:hypothetical protein
MLILMRSKRNHPGSRRCPGDFILFLPHIRKGLAGLSAFVSGSKNYEEERRFASYVSDDVEAHLIGLQEA